jgi:hypothetical protein
VTKIVLNVIVMLTLGMCVTVWRFS